MLWPLLRLLLLPCCCFPATEPSWLPPLAPSFLPRRRAGCRGGTGGGAPASSDLGRCYKIAQDYYKAVEAKGQHSYKQNQEVQADHERKCKAAGRG